MRARPRPQRHTIAQGTSYGTFLGATYANMFPERLRAIALDGTVDANRWMAPVGPQRLSTFLRVGSDKANAATLKSFLTLCGQARPPGKACAFSAGSANATRRRFETLLAMAAKKPIMVDSEPVDDSALLAMTLTTLYTVGPLTAYPGEESLKARARLGVRIVSRLACGSPLGASAGPEPDCRLCQVASRNAKCVPPRPARPPRRAQTWRASVCTRSARSAIGVASRGSRRFA